jgi:hypothetical protein
MSEALDSSILSSHLVVVCDSYHPPLRDKRKFMDKTGKVVLESHFAGLKVSQKV